MIAIIFCTIPNSNNRHTFKPSTKTPSITFVYWQLILGFKIICSNLAVTVIRLVEDWEANCMLSSVRLSLCLSGPWYSSQVTGFHSAICLISWFESGTCFVRVRTECSKCVCTRMYVSIWAYGYVQCVRVCVICPADWVVVKHFQMQHFSWQLK